MIDDREIWACANFYLKNHGENAQVLAARRADELLAAGEAEGHRTFMRIVDCIRKLEGVTPDGALQ